MLHPLLSLGYLVLSCFSDTETESNKLSAQNDATIVTSQRQDLTDGIYDNGSLDCGFILHTKTESNKLLVQNHTTIATLQRSDLTDGIYDNGPLGRGFIPRTLAAQEREKSLMASRDANYAIQHAALLEEKGVLFNKYWRAIILNKNNDNLTQEELQGLQTYEDINWKISCLERYKCCPINRHLQPIIAAISSSEKSEHCPFSVRVALHQLRQKIENSGLTVNQLETFKYEEKNASQVVQQYLEKYPQGIELLFTDEHKAFLVYDKESQVTSYIKTK